MLTSRKSLAKTSSTPGKTQLINHFLINEEWYLVDLPGYGYAKSSKKNREQWDQFIRQYLNNRSNLLYTFVLLDSRLAPQKIDLAFMEMLGIKQIPFVMVFTKIDKLSSSALQKNLASYRKEMLKVWEALPPIVKTSSANQYGKDELLKIIQETNQAFSFEA